MKQITFVIAVSILLFTACKHHETGHEETPVFVTTKPIIMDTLFYNEYVCQIKAIQHIELRALEKGYLQEIYVDEGQMVKKGQLMFKIMPLIYQAEKQKAAAEAEYAEIEYKNTKALADSHVVSANELALSKAHLQKALAELGLAEAHLSFTEIRAPFDGIMDHFYVRKGSLLDEGELLTTLSDNSKMWVYFNVPEAEYLTYKQKAANNADMKVTLRMANHEIFENAGKVETIEADFNNETGNIAFRATFDNSKGLLRHGETGDILMANELKNVMIIPQKATFEVLDKKYVFVVGKDNVVQAKMIETGVELPHLYVVNSGLSVDDMIVLEGLRKIKKDEKIKAEYKDLRKELKDLQHIHAE